MSPETLRILWRHAWACARIGDASGCTLGYAASVCLERRAAGDPLAGEPEPAQDTGERVRRALAGCARRLAGGGR